MLDDDERLILLHQRDAPLTLETMQAIRDAGIETALAQTWVSWHEIEPLPGIYNWSVPDELVARHKRAGLKTLLALYYKPPTWVRRIFYDAHAESFHRDVVFEVPWSAADPFDPDTAQAERDFLHRACERYSAADVTCYYAMHRSGERILPPGTGEFEEHEIVDGVVMPRQRIFAQYSDELWAAHHRAPVGSGAGNEYLWACFEAMKREFPNHVVNRIIYTFFTLPGWEYELGLKGGGVDKYWVGAEYCSNVVRNAGRITQYNAWGMVMGSINIEPVSQSDVVYRAPPQPTPEEIEAIAEAVRILGEL